MKKFLTVAIAVMMIAVMSVFVFAADEGKMYAVDSDYFGLGNMSAQFKGNEDDATKGCLGLGPVDYGDGEFEDAYMNFTFEVDTAGTYLISIRYDCKAKDGQTRCADMIVNDGDRIHLDIEQLPDWNTYAITTEEVELDAGENTITLKNVEGFDNSTYKAINVDYVAWELIPAETEAPETEAPETEAPETEAPETEAPETEAPETEAPETEAPETEAPETEAPETEAPETDPVEGDGGEDEEDAPQTGFVVAALMVVAIGSGAYIVSKKH